MITCSKIEFLVLTYPTGWTVVAFILGALWGSFLNVCIYRIPASQSVIWKRSYCKACQKSIRYLDMVPIISWCLLKGRCRSCSQPISVRYSLVELLTAVLFGLCAWKLSLPIACIGMIFVSFLIITAFIDLDHFIVPQGIVCWGLFLGVIASGFYPNLLGQTYAIAGVIQSLVGVFIGTGFIFWILVIAEHILGKPAMGLGDVLLLGLIGAYTGWMGAIFALFGGAAIGAIVLVPLILLERALGIRIGPRAQPEALAQELISSQSCADASPRLGLGVAVPFGPWLALGGFIYFLLFQNQFALNFIFQG